MRNQTWNRDGTLVADVELIDGPSPKAKDHITGKERKASAEEVEVLRARGKGTRLSALHSLLAAQDLTASQVSEMLRLERGL